MIYILCFPKEYSQTSHIGELHFIKGILRLYACFNLIKEVINWGIYPPIESVNLYSHTAIRTYASQTV